MIVEKSGECPFDTVAACHGEVDARFIVLRSTCLTAQNLVKNRGDKRWFADHGVVMSTLVTAKEAVHDISRFLYREVMTPREKVAEMISAYQKELRWSDSFMVGVHIRTGSVNKERVKWGRFLDEKDVRLFKRYVTELTEAYESGKNVLQLGRKDDFYAALVQKKQEMKKMAKQKEIKTNAMRMLDRMKIPYEAMTYECGDFIDGIQIADKLGLPHEKVYKTLVTVGNSKNYFVFVLPIEGELDLKKAAREVGEKSLAMLHVKDINAVTGYVRGGCTAVGMKKQYVTRIDASAQNLPTMVVSGGHLGTQLELKPEDLRKAANAEFADIVVE